MTAREQARFDMLKRVGTFGTDAEKTGDWHIANHVERQKKSKKPEPPKP